MNPRPREYVWKAPYKPTKAAEDASAQGPSSSRRNSSLSPKSQPVPAAPSTEDQFSFHFPRSDALQQNLTLGGRQFLTNQSPPTPNMSDPATVNEAEKQKMIASLRNHTVNTLSELRRIERIFATMGTPDVTEPMTTAWQYHVNSHMLLTELRSLTRNYPFSSECLDEAKRRVLTDPDSNRSWNYCWLVLTKVDSDNLIPYYAHHQASLPAMWGNVLPSPEGIQALSAAFVSEWKFALDQLLRHWETPPVGRDS